VGKATLILEVILKYSAVLSLLPIVWKKVTDNKEQKIAGKPLNSWKQLMLRRY
jgi:hypothetical protein